MSDNDEMKSYEVGDVKPEDIEDQNSDEDQDEEI